jgi:hypothetical protein
MGNLAKIPLFKNDYSTAARLLEECLAFRRSIEDSRGVSYSLAQIGLCHEALGDVDKAIEHYRTSAQVAGEIGDPLGRGISLTNLGRVFLVHGRHAEAQAALREGIDLWEGMRGKLGGEDAMRISLLDEQLQTYMLLVRSLSAQNQIEPALEVVERAKASALVDLLARRLALPLGPETDQEVTPTAAQMKQIAAEEKTTLVEYFLVTSLRDAAGKIHQKGKLLIWVVKPNGEIQPGDASLPPFLEGLGSETPPVPTAAGTPGWVSRDIKMATGASLPLQTPRELHSFLIEPIARHLPVIPEERVTFIPHHGLFLVPFAALQDGNGRYLIERHAISTALSIHVLSLSRKQRTRGHGALVVGDPDTTAAS